MHNYFVLCIHIFFWCVSAFFGGARFVDSLQEKKWSYFVFSQEWPPAACLNVPGGPKECKISDTVKGWSIHGLWPTSDKGYPQFCNESWPFKPELLKPLILALEAKWPNIYAHSSEVTFWRHEWLKHGTCATSLQAFDSEFKYFKESLYLHDKYDIHNFLQQSGITPNEKTPYVLKYIENALQVNVNATVKLFCKNHKEYSNPILTSMYICFDKKLQLIGCDKIDEPTCDHTYAYYLPFNRTY